MKGNWYQKLLDEIELLKNENAMLRKHQAQEERILPPLENHTLYALADKLNAGAALVDSEERFVYLNTGLEAMLGYKASELLGRSLGMFAPENEFQRFLGETLRRREGEKARYETQFFHKSGKLLDFLISAVPVMDEEGHFKGTFALWLDITHQKNLEKEYMHKRKLLLDLLDNAGVPIVFFDASLRVNMANIAAARRFGLPVGDMHQKPLDALYNPNTALKITNVLKKGHPARFEESYKSGSHTQYLNTSAHPTRDNKGKIQGVQLISHNITDFIAVAKQLEQKSSEMSWRNKQFQFLFRLTHLLATHDFDFKKLYAGLEDILQPLSYSLNLSAFRLKLDDELMEKDYQKPHDKQYTKPVYALGKEVGRVAYILYEDKTLQAYSPEEDLHEFFDITAGLFGQFYERVHFLQKVKENGVRMKTITNAVEDAMVVTNAACYMDFWNDAAAEMFGIDEQAARTRSFILECLPEPQRPALQAFRKQAETGQTPGSPLEITIQRGNTHGRPVEVTASAFCYRQRQYIVWIFRDITFRKRVQDEKRNLEAQLLQAQKMESVGTLAGGIAHDFNNILTPILGYADMAMDSLPDGHEVRDDLRHIVKGANRAKELVKQLLTFSRHFEHDKKLVYPHLLIEEVMTLLRASIPSNIQIIKNIKTKDARVLVPPIQLHQVLMNLCTNAYQAIGQDTGTIRLTLDTLQLTPQDARAHLKLSPGLYALLCVEDNGPGMDKQTMQRIFEPFFTTKELEQGTGLGLSAVHGIVTGSHGAIDVESEPGKGAAFFVYLPLASEQEEDRMLDEESVFEGNAHVLFVDDEREITRMAQSMFERHGFRVSVFNTGENALEAFLKTPGQFDILMTDQTMPGMQGLELAEAIKQHRPNLPVVLISGYSETPGNEGAQKAGVDMFIAKPIEANKLLDALRKMLAS